MCVVGGLLRSYSSRLAFLCAKTPHKLEFTSRNRPIGLSTASQIAMNEIWSLKDLEVQLHTITLPPVLQSLSYHNTCDQRQPNDSEIEWIVSVSQERRVRTHSYAFALQVPIPKPTPSLNLAFFAGLSASPERACLFDARDLSMPTFFALPRSFVCSKLLDCSAF